MDLYLKRFFLYTYIYIYSNNDIIVSENHNNIIVPKIKFPNDSGKSYVFVYSETTGKLFSKPIDPKYYNDYYRKTKKRNIM